MKKIITYGSFDMLHFGHQRLLERAKALGDYLIVGVTSDDYDQIRGKINLQQQVLQRVEAVRNLGLADEIIIEEYDGQKIDDILRYGIDIFAIGSDWKGKFDYLKQYCEVVYLDRTEGISSSGLRSAKRHVLIGFVGGGGMACKLLNECRFVNGLVPGPVLSDDSRFIQEVHSHGGKRCDTFEEVLGYSDAVYIATHPSLHYAHIEKALLLGKHVICEAPLALNVDECKRLYELADDRNLILFEAIKTAYSTAFHRLILLAKMGKIGKVVSVDATCSSLADLQGISANSLSEKWGTFDAWGPTALLPVFELLGEKYITCDIDVAYLDREQTFDGFVKASFAFSDAVATVKIGKAVKSEGTLIISGTEGYIYVPAPWWKTDYFEIRRERQEETRRYFYQLEGEGIRQMLVSFLKSIESGHNASRIHRNFSFAVAKCGTFLRKRENVHVLSSIRR